jgi:hypothetical protein
LVNNKIEGQRQNCIKYLSRMTIERIPKLLIQSKAEGRRYLEQLWKNGMNRLGSLYHDGKIPISSESFVIFSLHQTNIRAMKSKMVEWVVQVARAEVLRNLLFGIPELREFERPKY